MLRVSSNCHSMLAQARNSPLRTPAAAGPGQTYIGVSSKPNLVSMRRASKRLDGNKLMPSISNVAELDELRADSARPCARL